MRLDPVAASQRTTVEPALEAMLASAGFVPNSLLVMARRPGVVTALLGLAREVLFSNGLDRELTLCVAHVASTAAGCRYCEAHTASGLSRGGTDPGKLEALWSFESDDRFDARERAALRLARDAAQVPNAVTDAHFDELRLHFSDDEIVDLVAVVAVMGFFNRWNDTMATELESVPAEAAARHLAGSGWQPGKHA